MRSFAHCFVGPEPKSLEPGFVLPIFLTHEVVVVSIGNYERIMAVVEATGTKIDEMKPIEDHLEFHVT
jgi:tetraacyldisaccharide-1-P 4'-kinase